MGYNTGNFMVKILLGNAQKIVTDWLKDHNGATSAEVGDACYKFSYYGKQGGCSDPEHRKYRARYASKILQNLKKRGIVTVSVDGKWYLLE